MRCLRIGKPSTGGNEASRTCDVHTRHGGAELGVMGSLRVVLTECDDVAIDDVFDAAPGSEFSQLARFRRQSFQYFVG